MENKNTDIQKTGLKKSRCCFGECRKKTAPFIGYCNYCDQKYCALHRYPESHTCSNIKACRDASFKKNEDRLMAEKCVAAKV